MSEEPARKKRRTGKTVRRKRFSPNWNSVLVPAVRLPFVEPVSNGKEKDNYVNNFKALLEDSDLTINDVKQNYCGYVNCKVELPPESFDSPDDPDEEREVPYMFLCFMTSDDSNEEKVQIIRAKHRPNLFGDVSHAKKKLFDALGRKPPTMDNIIGVNQSMTYIRNDKPCEGPEFDIASYVDYALKQNKPKPTRNIISNSSAGRSSNKKQSNRSNKKDNVARNKPLSNATTTASKSSTSTTKQSKSSDNTRKGNVTNSKSNASKPTSTTTTRGSTKTTATASKTKVASNSGNQNNRNKENATVNQKGSASTQGNFLVVYSSSKIEKLAKGSVISDDIMTRVNPKIIGQILTRYRISAESTDTMTNAMMFSIQEKQVSEGAKTWDNTTGLKAIAMFVSKQKDVNSNNRSGTENGKNVNTNSKKRITPSVSSPSTSATVTATISKTTTNSSTAGNTNKSSGSANSSTSKLGNTTVAKPSNSNNSNVNASKNIPKKDIQKAKSDGGTTLKTPSSNTSSGKKQLNQTPSHGGNQVDDDFNNIEMLDQLLDEHTTNSNNNEIGDICQDDEKGKQPLREVILEANKKELRSGKPVLGQPAGHVNIKPETKPSGKDTIRSNNNNNNIVGSGKHVTININDANNTPNNYMDTSHDNSVFCCNSRLPLNISTDIKKILDQYDVKHSSPLLNNLAKLRLQLINSSLWQQVMNHDPFRYFGAKPEPEINIDSVRKLIADLKIRNTSVPIVTVLNNVIQNMHVYLKPKWGTRTSDSVTNLKQWDSHVDTTPINEILFKQFIMLGLTKELFQKKVPVDVPVSDKDDVMLALFSDGNDIDTNQPLPMIMDSNIVEDDNNVLLKALSPELRSTNLDWKNNSFAITNIYCVHTMIYHPINLQYVEMIKKRSNILDLFADITSYDDMVSKLFEVHNHKDAELMEHMNANIFYILNVFNQLFPLHPYNVGPLPDKMKGIIFKN